MTTDPTEAGAPDADSTMSARRKFLAVQPNPRATLDYLCVLKGSTPDQETALALRYVPDKLTLPADSFADYLAAFTDAAALSPEMMALTVLDDINNEVVPRWVQVITTRSGRDEAKHQIIVEDRQPKWDNPALLARLAP